MEEKQVYNKEKIYDIMNTTQSNYSNMLRRLNAEKNFSNFVVTYYSIVLIIYSLTAEFFSEQFNVKLSSYFNIILSVVILAYSLIITNAKYSERVQSAEKVLNELKAKKRELTDDNIEKKRSEYDAIISKAEYRSETDFLLTLKQRCKKNDVKWFKYKMDLNELEKKDEEEAKKLKEYLSENFPITQQMKIWIRYIWKCVIILVPIILFLICFVDNSSSVPTRLYLDK